MKLDRAKGFVVHHTDKTITINGNTAPITAGLFVVTGIAKIISLRGDVITAQLAANLTACQLDIFPTGGASVALTKVAGAPAIDSFEVGSLLGKFADVDKILNVKRANVAIYAESGLNLEDIPYTFKVGKKNGVVTTIRFLYTAGGDYSLETGQIVWHCEWQPSSHDGHIAAA
ncbi:hypothetical protein ES703_70326 [subsurface metagenome]